MNDLQIISAIAGGAIGSLSLLKAWDWWRERVDSDMEKQHLVDTDLLDRIHCLELKLKDATIAAQTEIMSKIGDALVVMSKTDSANSAILARLSKSVEKVHERVDGVYLSLDKHIQSNNEDFKQINKEFVSEIHCNSKMAAIGIK